MPYRGDKEQLRVRVGELEEHLAVAQRRIAVLEARELPLSLSPLGPAELACVTTVSGKLDEAMSNGLDFDLQELFGGIHTSHETQRLSWEHGPEANRQVRYTIDQRGDELAVAGVEKLGSLRGALFGGVLGGLGGGLAMPSAVVGRLIGLPAWLSIVLWVVMVFFGARALYARTARKRQRALAMFVEGIAHALDARTRGPRVDPKNDAL